MLINNKSLIKTVNKLNLTDDEREKFNKISEDDRGNFLYNGKPITGGATEEQISQIEANKTAIGDENSGLVKEVNNIKNTELQNLNTAIQTLETLVGVDETVGDKTELPSGDANIIASINRIDSKPSGTVTDEQISTAVNNYLTEHPVSSGATAEQAAQIQANKTAIGDTNSGLIKEVNNLKNANGTFKNIYANNDMPTVFITSSTLTNLASKADGKANCEFEIRFKNQIIKCFGTGAVQGTSSAAYPAKNYTFKFYSDKENTTKFKIDVGWGSQNKYCFKKNWIDSTHTRNLSGARIAYDMVNSRPESDFKTNLLKAPHNGSVDGFPTKVYVNGEFWGLYTWNIPKDAWMFNMKDDNPNHMVLCAEYNNDGNMSVTNTCQFRALWGGESDTNWSIEVGTYSEALKNSFNNAISHVMNSSDEDFKANFSNYFDLYSILDYYCFSYLTAHIDGLGKNMLMATFDGIHWGACLYDMDSIYGADWNGQSFKNINIKCPEEYQENNSLLWQRVEKSFSQELYDRYVELRKGALSLGNIVTHVEEIYNLIPDRVFKEDWTKWSGIPLQATNTLTRFRTFMKNRAVYVDSEFESFDTTPKPVSGVILDSYTITTNQNSPITLTATVKPNTAINKNVTWSCDDETVQLTPSGLTCEVNCPNLGTPKVTVTTEEGSFTATCTITVIKEGTVITDGLVRYIDLALDEGIIATNPTTIKDKVDDSITYSVSGANQLYTQENITRDSVGWKKSGLRGKEYSLGRIGIEAFQYQMPEQFTIECCQSFNGVADLVRILSIRNTFTDMIFQINYHEGKIQIQNGLKTISSSYSLEVNQLYHFTITYNGINVRLLINGSEVIGTQAFTKAGDSTTFYVKPFGISDGANVEGTVDGLMCYFKIYNRVLNDNEIASNYAVESANRVMDR